MEMKNRIDGGEDQEIKNKMKKKRSRGMHVIGVVLYMLRRRRKRKPFNNWFWRRVVESVRQLKHGDITIMPSSNNVTLLPPSSSPAREEGAPPAVSDDQVSERVEVFTATPCSSSSGISGYGSAKSLRDLDCLDEDDDDDGYDDDDECYFDDDGGDEMIDVKAEEFIVRFYEQMRMQNQAYTERYKAKGMITTTV